MPTAGQALTMGGYILIGLIAVIIAGAITVALVLLILPFIGIIMPAVMALALFVVLVVATISGIYFLGFVGAVVSTFFKTTEVRPGSYRIKQTKEAGRRQKGRTKKSK